MGKTWTLGEAQAQVGRLGSMLGQAREAALRASELDGEMQELSQRIFLSGGMHVDVAAAARRRAERDKAASEAQAAIAAIEEAGVRVVENEAGALEFPCLAEGRTVLLCWAMGDDEIERWREDEEDSEERELGDGLFGRERPN